MGGRISNGRMYGVLAQLAKLSNEFYLNVETVYIGDSDGRSGLPSLLGWLRVRQTRSPARLGASGEWTEGGSSDYKDSGTGRGG